MPDLTAALRRLADELEKEERGEQTAAQEAAREERIERLEQLVAQAPSAQVKDAIGELTDDERELILEHRNGSSPEEKGGPGGGGDDETEIPESRPRQRVSRRDVPKIWAGDDEPAHVEYLDEEGAVKVRPGRRQGQPYEFEVEEIEDEEPDE